MWPYHNNLKFPEIFIKSKITTALLKRKSLIFEMANMCKNVNPYCAYEQLMELLWWIDSTFCVHFYWLSCDTYKHMPLYYILLLCSVFCIVDQAQASWWSGLCNCRSCTGHLSSLYWSQLAVTICQSEPLLMTSSVSNQSLSTEWYPYLCLHGTLYNVFLITSKLVSLVSSGSCWL